MASANPWGSESFAQSAADFDNQAGLTSVPPGPFYALLSRACPDTRVQATELDAVRVIEGKLAVAAAMRAAAHDNTEVEFGQPGSNGRYRFANTPREVAMAIRQGLGPSSLLARSADTIALVTDTVEYTTQIPLDRINEVVDMLAEQARRVGLGNLPVLRFRSKIENDRAGVTVSAHW
jgi:hypothetical protein